jgi:tetratricopeptide (TPR) repeat protein
MTAPDPNEPASVESAPVDPAGLDPISDAASAQDAAQQTTHEAQLRVQLDADPMHHPSALMLAGLLLRDGQVDAAIALLTEHAADRDCGDLLREYFIGERMNDQVQRLVAQRGVDPSASGLVDLAIASHLRGDLENALTHCRLAIKAHPGYAPAYNHEGRALFNAGRAKPARVALIKAIRLAPNYAEAWHNLAHVLRGAREFDQADHAYGHALRLRPAYRSALLNRGIVQTALGRPTDALETFRALLSIDPNHVDACFNLAVCEHALHRDDAARASYERAIKLDPRNPRTYLQLGRLCYELRDSEGALQQFRKALDVNPHDPEAWSEIAMVHEQADRLEDAQRAVAAGLARAPTHPGLHLEQANLARHRGDFNAALTGLRAIDVETLHPRLHARHRAALELTLERLGQSQPASDARN